jgi:alcohol dehydrogenase class IV
VYDEIPSVANTEFIDTAVYFTKRTECDLVIGFGGMEAINAAKAIALLNNNYLFCEDIFEARNLEAPLKMITIPAQPLFGFEILPMFYVTDIHDFSRKVYWSNGLYPAMTLIDPMLAATISEDKTANTGISTLAMATESIISTVTNEFSNTYALKAMDLTFKYLVAAYRDPHNPQPRYPLAIASLMAGIAFSTSFLSVSLSIGMALRTDADPDGNSDRAHAAPCHGVKPYRFAGTLCADGQGHGRRCPDITVMRRRSRQLRGAPY